MEIEGIFVGMSDWIVEPLPVELVINDETVLITLEADPITIGRTDPRLGFTPEVDLLPYDARRHGVSREHLSLFQKDGRVFVMDMDSENGTYLNAVLLVPGTAYPVFSGDMLRLGLLFAQIAY